MFLKENCLDCNHTPQSSSCCSCLRINPVQIDLMVKYKCKNLCFNPLWMNGCSACFPFSRAQFVRRVLSRFTSLLFLDRSILLFFRSLYIVLTDGFHFVDNSCGILEKNRWKCMTCRKKLWQYKISVAFSLSRLYLCSHSSNIRLLALALSTYQHIPGLLN